MSFTNQEDVKKIYNIHTGYAKSSWYLNFVSGGAETIFTTTKIDLHRKYRRLLSAPISESSLQVHSSQVHSRADLAIQKMREEMSTRGVADIAKWWLFMATDIIGELTFGESFQTLEQGKVHIAASSSSWHLISYFLS